MNHNFDFNNVDHLHKIIFGLTLAMVSDAPVKALSNFKEFDKAAKEVNKLDDEAMTKFVGAEFANLETRDCGEAAFELTAIVLRGKPIGSV